MDKVAKLPLEELTTEANKTLQELQGTSKAATVMLDSTDKTMTSAHQILSTLEPGSTTHYELEQLLRELTQAASSVKQLTDYLEQNPNAVIRGKNEQ
jgi:paraquat-inducible protein B